MSTSLAPVGTICGAIAVVPVFCDNCGTLFATESLLGGDWRQVSFENVGFGPCPVCGSTGRVLDGTYDFIGDTIRVLSAPEWSLERLGWLQERIAAARAALVAPEAVVDEVVAASPELAALVRPLLQKGWKALQILVTILAIVTFVQSQANPAATPGDIDRAVQSIVETVHHEAIQGSAGLGGASHGSTKPQSQRKKPSSASRKKRLGKTYGKQKKRRRR